MKPLKQVGALCVCVTYDEKPLILLVTSRDTGRWVIPKGWPAKRLKAYEAAAREAMEEAGVSGKIGQKPIGSYQCYRPHQSGDQLHTVSVYVMAVGRCRQLRHSRFRHGRGCHLQLDQGSVAALRQFNSNRIVPALGAVILAQLIAELPGFNPDDGIDIRVEVIGSVEDLSGDAVALQPFAAPGQSFAEMYSRKRWRRLECRNGPLARMRSSSSRTAICPESVQHWSGDAVMAELRFPTHRASGPRLATVRYYDYPQ